MIERAPHRPEPRGELSAWLLDVLPTTVRTLEPPRLPDDDPIVSEDAPLALYLLYELHYRGWPGVDENWEWEPSLLSLRQQLEHDLEARARELVGQHELDEPVGQVLRSLTVGAGQQEPEHSISAWLVDRGDLTQVREAAVHRSAYQLKEADPHTWVIPRLAGRPKAALVTIQADEYGEGSEQDVHAELFATTMRRLGLDPRYHAYIDHIPGVTLSSVNLLTLFSLHRRLRGAAVGHLAAFEMASVAVMADLSLALRRLGFDSWTRLFYDTHVVADAAHQTIACEDLAAALAEQEPELGADIAFGARAVGAVERHITDHVIGAWRDGRTSLRSPLPEAQELPGMGPPPEPADDPREDAVA